MNFNLNNGIEKAEISGFEDESSILDEHLHERQRVDEASALSTAAEFIALNIYPERRVLSGEKTLKVLLKYSLRFGEMAVYRYTEDGNDYCFHVLQITDEGAAGLIWKHCRLNTGEKVWLSSWHCHTVMYRMPLILWTAFRV